MCTLRVQIRVIYLAVTTDLSCVMRRVCADAITASRQHCVVIDNGWLPGWLHARCCTKEFHRCVFAKHAPRACVGKMRKLLLFIPARLHGNTFVARVSYNFLRDSVCYCLIRSIQPLFFRHTFFNPRIAALGTCRRFETRRI